jgi:probable RNA-binding protein EIF1AD
MGYRRSILQHADTYRPKEFIKKSTYILDSDDEESTVGKMPPADSDED